MRRYISACNYSNSYYLPVGILVIRLSGVLKVWWTTEPSTRKDGGDLKADGIDYADPCGILAIDGSEAFCIELRLAMLDELFLEPPRELAELDREFVNFSSIWSFVRGFESMASISCIRS